MKETPPQIKKCNRPAMDGHKCENRAVFDVMGHKDRDGNIVEWEAECPWCGSIWWIPVKHNRSRPKLYKK